MANHVGWVVALGAAGGLALGFILGRGGLVSAAEERDPEPRQTDQLERRIDELQHRLRDAQAAADRAARTIQRSEKPGAQSGTEEMREKRGVTAVRADIRSAMADRDGKRLLELLSELAALGPAHHAEVADHWTTLVNLSSSELDAYGLNRIQLAGALSGETEIMRFALVESHRNPMLRQFTAQTLEKASMAAQRSILATLDFSTEKDKRVLHPLVRAAGQFLDPIFVDRFLHLVGRTDLYNNSRQNIAFQIAQIPGEESRIALDKLRAEGGHERILPMLESLASPPATGLLITNAGHPTSDRLGLNDIILEYAERPIRTQADLTLADAATSPGDLVPVKILRNGTVQTVFLEVSRSATGHLHFNAMPIRKRD